MKQVAWSLLLLAASPFAVAQQLGDAGFTPEIGTPLHAGGKGPVVCLDEAHHNFHTLDGRFAAFGALLQRDGYVVRPSRTAFDAASLSACAVLVIANAQPGDEPWDRYPTPTPSAFTPEEVQAVHAWVQGGGRLLLIADHMPLAGAAKSLAAAFEVEFTDGFAFAGNDDAARGQPTLFRRDDGTLVDHAILRGRAGIDAVTQLRSFTGQAFRAPGAQPLLVLPPGFISLHPAQAWAFDDDTPQVAVGGWLQGAVKEVGAGRAAFFGEAAMFTAQRAGPQAVPVGMNAPGAEQNARFVLYLVQWLAAPQAAAARERRR
jgi:hypothetical protein